MSGLGGQSPQQTVVIAGGNVLGGKGGSTYNPGSVAITGGTITGVAGTFSPLTATGLFTEAAEDGITAFAGGGKASATALSATKNLHRISVCATAADSVLMPPALAGQAHFLRNDGAAAAQVFGQSSDTINGVATGTGISLAAGTGIWLCCETAANWTTSFNSSAPGAIGNVTPAAIASTAIVIAQGTISAATSPLAITETRNTVGTTYPGITYTITDTASSATSMFMRFLGGASGTQVQLSVDKNGALTTNSTIQGGGTIQALGRLQLTVSSVNKFLAGLTSAVQLASDYPIYWSSTTGASAADDVNINRSGVAELSIGSTTVNALGSLKLTNLTASGFVKTGSFTVGTLPAAATAGAGGRAFVTDALTTLTLGIGTALAAGGANKTTCFSDGSSYFYG